MYVLVLVVNLLVNQLKPRILFKVIFITFTIKVREFGHRNVSYSHAPTALTFIYYSTLHMKYGNETEMVAWMQSTFPNRVLVPAPDQLDAHRPHVLRVATTQNSVKMGSWRWFSRD